MASRPKRRRTSNQTAETETQALVKECMTAALPIIESVVKECFQSRNLQNRQATLVQPVPSDPDQPSNHPSTETIVRDNSAFQAIVNQTDSKIQRTFSRHESEKNISSTGIATPLTSTADFLIRSSLTEDSLSSYRNIFATYKSFIHDQVDKNLSPLPPSLSHLLLYIAHCYQIGLAASTTRTHISALSFTFQ